VAQALDDAPAVEARHHEVQGDEVGPARRDLLEGDEAVARHHHLVPGVLEHVRFQVPDRLVVVDHEDELGHGQMIHPKTGADNGKGKI
jgi:hypothetical protein